MTTHEVAHVAATTLRSFTVPLLGGIGAGAGILGNHVVLVGAVVAALGVITKAVHRAAVRTRRVADRVEDTWENMQMIPVVVAQVAELGDEQGRVRDVLADQAREISSLHGMLAQVLERDPAARTRSTDSPEDLTS